MMIVVPQISILIEDANLKVIISFL